MDYLTQICRLIGFIEQNIKGKLNYSELEKSVGFSYRYIREFFQKSTNVTLSRYILSRKIANAAFEIRHSEKSITEIAFEYDFSNLETFTRAFRRGTGITPSEFKKSNFLCGRRIICPGVFAPVILNNDNLRFTLPKLWEVNEVGEIIKTSDGCILYGVPKVQFGMEADGQKMEMPFPMVTKVVLNYMGQDIGYSQIMAATGLSFSQRWCVHGWNYASIDSRTLYDKPFKSFELGFKGAGRKFNISVNFDNIKSITKDEAFSLIKLEIDCGRPLIALGVVGPPEPCIVTGYKNNGKTLLGHSLYQRSDKGFEFDESGYFIKDDWWDNTEAVMSIGEEIGEMMSAKNILQNALTVMTQEKVGAYDGGEYYYNGQAAYEAWAKAVEDDKSWLCVEAGACHADQERMLRARRMAAIFIDSLSKKYPDISEKLNKCAKLLSLVSECAINLNKIRLGKKSNMDNHKEVRFVTAMHIRQAAQYEKEAVDILKGIIDKL